jgi:hypothetical protein
VTAINAKDAILKAKNEIAEENLKKGVEALKRKLREQNAAEAVLANVKREIAELELQIEQGNI